MAKFRFQVQRKQHQHQHQQQEAIQQAQAARQAQPVTTGAAEARSLLDSCLKEAHGMAVVSNQLLVELEGSETVVALSAQGSSAVSDCQRLLV